MVSGSRCDAWLDGADTYDEEVGAVVDDVGETGAGAGEPVTSGKGGASDDSRAGESVPEGEGAGPSSSSSAIISADLS